MAQEKKLEEEFMQRMNIKFRGVVDLSKIGEKDMWFEEEEGLRRFLIKNGILDESKCKKVPKIVEE